MGHKIRCLRRFASPPPTRLVGATPASRIVIPPLTSRVGFRWPPWGGRCLPGAGKIFGGNLHGRPVAHARWTVNDLRREAAPRRGRLVASVGPWRRADDRRGGGSLACRMLSRGQRNPASLMVGSAPDSGPGHEGQGASEFDPNRTLRLTAGVSDLI